MRSEEYKLLLKRYQEGLTDPEETRQLDQWYDALHSGIHLSENDQERERLVAQKWAELMSRQQPTIAPEVTPIPASTSWLSGSRSKWAIAASVILMIMTGYLLSDRQFPLESLGFITATSTEMTDGPLIVTTNQTNSPLVLTLKDLSTVRLMPGSTLRYPKTFGPARRNVYLNGDAFFEVSKNPKKPFFVYTHAVVTKVLGTSFMIRSDDKSENVMVTVKTGKVAVFQAKQDHTTLENPEPEKSGVLLTPNQQVVFQSRERKMVRTLVESPELIVKELHAVPFSFNNSPVSTVFAAIETAYGVDIVFDEAALKECALTSSLEDETLFEKLTIICKLLNLNYKVIDTRIIISGSGCKNS